MPAYCIACGRSLYDCAIVQWARLEIERTSTRLHFCRNCEYVFLFRIALGRAQYSRSTLNGLSRRRKSSLYGALLQGTLDLLILQTLTRGPTNGQMIALKIFRGSNQAISALPGSLYPALHRIERRSDISPFWTTSDTHRRVRLYRLTLTGRRELASQLGRWEQLLRAVELLLPGK